MQLCNAACVLGEDKNEVHWVGARDWNVLDFVDGVWLEAIFGCTLEDRLQTWSILKLFIGVWILLCL